MAARRFYEILSLIMGVISQATNLAYRVFSRSGPRAKKAILSAWDGLVYRGPIWRFMVSRLPKQRQVTSDYAHTNITPVDISSQLRDAGVTLREFNIDVDDYHDYLEKARYDDYPNYLQGGKAPSFPEK